MHFSDRIGRITEFSENDEVGMDEASSELTASALIFLLLEDVDLVDG